jgi:hypothetical protein
MSYSLCQAVTCCHCCDVSKKHENFRRSKKVITKLDDCRFIEEAATRHHHALFVKKFYEFPMA